MKKNGIKTDEVFKELVVLKKNIVKYVNGKKVEKQQNMYPGYIFANMILTDNVIVALRNFIQVISSLLYLMNFSD
jgi:transcription antitermination factor NusG